MLGGASGKGMRQLAGSFQIFKVFVVRGHSLLVRWEELFTPAKGWEEQQVNRAATSESDGEAYGFSPLLAKRNPGGSQTMSS